MTEAPCNLHQACTFFSCSEAPEDSQSGSRCLLLACCTIVFLQCATVAAIVASASLTSCETNSHCRLHGDFCEVPPDNVAVAKARCNFCGWATPLTLQVGEGFNHSLLTWTCANPDLVAVPRGVGQDGMWSAAAVSNWCDACVHLVTGRVDTTTEDQHMHENIAAMGVFDWVALLLATVFVALSVVGELKDIELCLILLDRATAIKPARRFGLKLLAGIRRWVFLPGLVMAIPFLVALLASDALSICLNTIATLFLVDCDNIAYTLGLGERVRARVEEAARVELTAEDIRALQINRTTYVAMITVCVMLVMVLLSAGSAPHGLLPPFGFFWLAGMGRTMIPAAQRPSGRRIGIGRLVIETTASSILGLFCFFFLFGANFMV
eukprot:COSAG06_NODE_1291_length_9980_cov_166.860237_9_plen_381_part_00